MQDNEPLGFIDDLIGQEILDKVFKRIRLPLIDKVQQIVLTVLDKEKDKSKEVETLRIDLVLSDQRGARLKRIKIQYILGQKLILEYIGLRYYQKGKYKQKIINKPKEVVSIFTIYKIKEKKVTLLDIVPLDRLVPKGNPYQKKRRIA